MNHPCGRTAAARWLQPSPAHGKTKGGRLTSAVRPTLLVIAVSMMAVLLMVVLFDARWTPSGGGGDTSWVSTGARVVFNAAKLKFFMVFPHLHIQCPANEAPIPW
ncbi:hypothetical protein ABZP36_007155 [Zizania latifolia]